MRVPDAPNFARLPYMTTPFDTGDDAYDRVLLHVDDFGQSLLVGVRVVPPESAGAMDGDEPRTVLRTLSEAILTGAWGDLPAPPELVLVSEAWPTTTPGDGCLRVSRAVKGSNLVQAQGRRPTADDTFDTMIAVIVARRGPVVAFVLAQSDESPDDAPGTARLAEDALRRLRVAAGP